MGKLISLDFIFFYPRSPSSYAFSSISHFCITFIVVLVIIIPLRSLLSYSIEAGWRMYASATRPPSVQTMSCHLSVHCPAILGSAGKSLIRPLKTNFSDILIKIPLFYTPKWKCRLQNGTHLVSASVYSHQSAPRTVNVCGSSKQTLRIYQMIWASLVAFWPACYWIGYQIPAVYSHRWRTSFLRAGSWSSYLPIPSTRSSLARLVATFHKN